MQRILKTTLAATALAAVWHPAQAQSNAELLAQLQALQAEVQKLKDQVAATRPAVAGNPAPVAEAVAIEPVTRADIDGLRSDLENYKYDQQRQRETKSPATLRGTTIGGTVQARATVNSPGTASGSTTVADTRHSSFDIPQATLSFAGSLYRDYAEGRNLDFRLAFQYVPNATSGAAIQGSAPNGSQLNATDAYLRYSPLPTATGLEDPRLNITVGQQQIPYGLEAQVGEELRPLINQATFITSQGVGTRQIGVIARGDIEPYVDYGANYRAPLFEYALGVFNGSGPNKSDDNGAKDWIARGAFTLPVDYASVWRELKFGASYYRGTQNLARTVSGTTSVVGGGRKDRYGFDIYYNHSPFGVTYEYSRGVDAALAASTGLATNDVVSRGQYLTLYYTWGEQFVNAFRAQAKYDDWWPKSYQLFLRADDYDPNVRTGNNRQLTATLGFNVFFAETTKFQLNAVRTTYASPTTPTSTGLLAQFQYGF